MESKKATQSAKAFIIKYSSCLFLLLLCIVVPKAALVKGDITSAFLFHFTHANIFHMLANFYAIALFRPRWENVPVAYLSATAAALMPIAAVSMPTVGISGMAFALLARRDAILCIWNWRLLGLNFLLAFVPAYNWKIHMFSYIFAFLFWKAYLTIRNHYGKGKTK